MCHIKLHKSMEGLLPLPLKMRKQRPLALDFREHGGQRKDLNISL